MTDIRTHHDIIPDFAEFPTLQSVRDGEFDDPTTWDAGRAPGASDILMITTRVQLASPEATVRVIGVREGGELSVDPGQSTRLILETLLVLPGGALVVEVPSPDVQAEIVFADVWPDTLDDGEGLFDPRQWGTGLLVVNGKCVMTGAPRLPAWLRLVREPKAGDRELEAELDVQGWQRGDVLFIPDSRGQSVGSMRRAPKTPPRWERVAVESANGTTVRLAQPLRFDHPGARDAETGTLDFLPHVANLTRNVVLRSSNPAGARGHVAMFARTDMRLSHVRIQDCGRSRVGIFHSTTFNRDGTVRSIGQNHIGRYSLHLHHLLGPEGLPADVPQWEVNGVVIDGGLRWGLACHDSHYGRIVDTISVRIGGAAFMTEDGSESENVIERCFAGQIIGSGEPVYGIGRDDATDLGHEGVGFWFRGPMNYVRDCVAVNTSRPAIAYVAIALDDVLREVPMFKGQDPHHQGRKVDVQHTPILQADRLEAYGGCEDALHLREVGMGGGEWKSETPESVFNDLRAWHCSQSGSFSRSTHRIKLVRPVMRGTPERNAMTGVSGKHRQIHEMTVVDPDISGCAVGIEVPLLMDMLGSTNHPVAPFLVIGGRVRCARGITMEGQNESVDNPRNPVDQLPGRRVIVRGTDLRPLNFKIRPVAAKDLFAIYLYWVDPTKSRRNTNYVVKDEFLVEGYNGTGETVRIYYLEQRADAIMPASGVTSNGSRIVGAPEAGLSNTEAWERHGVAVAGSVAPCVDTQPGIQGLVCREDSR